jgi:hypothetical protein
VPSTRGSSRRSHADSPSRSQHGPGSH